MKMNTQRTIAGIVTMMLGVAALANAQKVATTSMQFLKVMPVARATAMGDAYSALARGAEAVFWNPGGVALVQNPELSSTYVDWLFDTRQGALSYAMSLEDWGAVGFQIQYVDYGVFEETVANEASLKQSPFPGLTGRQFRPFSSLIGVSYARNLTERFSTGITVKFAHETLFRGDAVSVVTEAGSTELVNTGTNGLLFDFGLVYHTGYRSIRIATAIQNFGSSLQYAKVASPAPLMFRLGLSADLVGFNSLVSADEESRVSAAFDLFQPNDYTQQMHAGVEYSYQERFALRMGYKFNYDTEGLTFGGGIRQEFAGINLVLDYSFGTMGEYLGSAHRLSLGAGL